MKNKNLFVDTSSLIKRYVLEKGSDEVDNFFTESSSVSISQITKIEFNSALKRRLSEKYLTDKNYNTVLKEFTIDFPNFIITQLNSDIEEIGIKLIKKYQLKTLDSIQLASGIFSNTDLFITSDLKLFKIAQIEIGKKAVFIG